MLAAPRLRRPRTCRGCWPPWRAGSGPPLRGGQVYTDDLAPVEWLTDLSIIRYATGAR